MLVEVRPRCPDVELSLFDFEPPGGFEDVASGRLDVLVTNQYPGMPDPPGSFDPMLDDQLMLVGCRVGFETNEYDATVTLARRGFGMALVPQLVLSAQPDASLASTLVVDGAPLARQVGVVCRQPVRSREIEIFVEAVRDAADSISAAC